MSQDKNAGNQKCVVGSGDRAMIFAATEDCHFTTICFTALTGEPVMDVVIIAKLTELLLQEAYGLDLNAEWIGEENDLGRNIGPGRRYPGGPTCTFQGKEVPCFTTNSESGGITSELLAQCLKKMDDLQLFLRSPDLPDPFILLDGHESRLQIPFLQYINNDDHRRHVILGLPNGTAKWQVGDSKEQNGEMKRRLVLEKRKVLRDKRVHCEPPKIDKTNVIPMLNNAFPHAFGNVEGNKKAIADRGLGPLNRACLTDPEILKTRVNTEKDPGST
jgi:hypothetical protein